MEKKKHMAHIREPSKYASCQVLLSGSHKSIHRFTPDGAKSKSDTISKINCKVMLNSFPMNGHTLGFCPWNQKLENFVSPKVKVSLWESKLKESPSKCYQLFNDRKLKNLRLDGWHREFMKLCV